MIKSNKDQMKQLLILQEYFVKYSEQKIATKKIVDKLVVINKEHIDITSCTKDELAEIAIILLKLEKAHQKLIIISTAIHASTAKLMYITFEEMTYNEINMKTKVVIKHEDKDKPNKSSDIVH